jgi:hypothetical protein
MLSFGSQSDTANWGYYRTFYGNVRFEIHDISAHDGRRFYRAEMSMWLVDANGATHAGGTAWKYWGQAATIYMGNIGPDKTLRLRTRVVIHETSVGPGTIGSGTWRGRLVWG